MSLVYMQNASFILNQNKLLKNVNFKIDEKERICLIGNNGTGKSTFLNIISKKEPLDHGSIVYKKNIKIEYLEQNVIHNNTKSIYEFICEGIGKESKYLKHHFYVLNNKKLKTSKNDIKLLIQLEEIFDKKKLWKRKEKIDNIIKIFGLKSYSALSTLSGGWLRKVELGKILISEPDLIILDEPTNHLDIITINWLTKFLKKHLISLLFISHDRDFIKNLSTRIVHLQSGNLISWTGDYNSFLNYQSCNDYIVKINETKFNKKLEKEKLWSNSGIKARSTKNESRIKNLKYMINAKESKKNTTKKIKILINEDNYEGHVFFKLKNICLHINKTILINNFSDTIKKGEKIALIGTNGSGKSTLLKLILDKLKPNSGTIDCNTNIKIAYFDQKRTKINLEKTILDNLSYKNEEIIINDKKYHKLKYLENFLFSKEKIKLKAKVLSGGEINKLLLAKLFLKKSNVLILDEPTNDLDLESLKNLESALKKYKGIILLVSHDKKFIENVANKYWNFEDNGHINIYLNFPQIKELTNVEKPYLKKFYIKNNIKKMSIKNQLISKTLKYDLKKELKNIPRKIEKIENYIHKLQNKINTSNFFCSLSNEKKEILHQLKNAEIKLENQLLRWEYLELHNDN
ncbi:MAG: ATP-binding cassette domain-containing protein [Buchnera aphidicola (Floraphis choui)]